MPRKNQKTLVILDSHAVLHRAYHALPNLMTKDGTPTGALYGFSTMVLGIADKIKPDYIVAAFDMPEATFRHAAFDQYKAGRPKADDMLVSQLIAARELCTALGIPVYEKAGFEADDIVGTIVSKLKNENVRIVIATGDMDTLQLVRDDTVVVYTLKKGITDTVLLNEEKVIEKMGFGPELVADYKGLRGDPSDNIPGVPGIGEKTGTDLIKNFGSLDAIYNTLEVRPKEFEEKGIKPRIVELLKTHKEDAYFSKVLATICLDAPVDFIIPADTWDTSFDRNAFAQFCKRYEFHSLAKRVLGEVSSAGQEQASEKKEYKKSKRESVSSSLNQGKSASLASSQGGLFVNCSISHQKLRELQVMAWLIDSDSSGISLEDMYERYHTDDPNTLHDILVQELKKHDLLTVYNEIEKPLFPIVAAMKDRGVMIDVAYLKKLGTEYQTLLTAHAHKMETLAGEAFNPRSPKQLSHILFDVLHLGEKIRNKKTSTGMKSTKEEVLEELKGTHPIIDILMSFREIDKLFSTYVAVLPTLADKENRIHATFLQDGAATGRFSSNNPNLQNIPVSDTEGKRIRQGFIAPKGFSLVAFDYSQIELRIAAELSGDPGLIEAFIGKTDVHTAVAVKVFGVQPKEVTKDMRRKAKVINFGVLYGMGVNALAKNLGTTRAEAEVFYDNYFRQFPTLKEFCADVVADAKKTGYTKTLFGRKRFLPALRSPLPFIRAYAERAALNAPIQGTATADIVKLALIFVDKFIQENHLTESVHPVMQVHDEIVFEIKSDTVDSVIPKIKHILEHVYEQSFIHYTPVVPLEVHVKRGVNWGDMKSL